MRQNLKCFYLYQIQSQNILLLFSHFEKVMQIVVKFIHLKTLLKNATVKKEGLNYF